MASCCILFLIWCRNSLGVIVLFFDSVFMVIWNICWYRLLLNLLSIFFILVMRYLVMVRLFFWLNWVLLLVIRIWIRFCFWKLLLIGFFWMGVGIFLGGSFLNGRFVIFFGFLVGKGGLFLVLGGGGFWGSDLGDDGGGVFCRWWVCFCWWVFCWCFCFFLCSFVFIVLLALLIRSCLFMFIRLVYFWMYSECLIGLGILEIFLMIFCMSLDSFIGLFVVFFCNSFVWNMMKFLVFWLM